MDIPEPMVNTQVRQMADEFTQRIQSQGLTVDQYFQFTGMDSQKFLESLRPQAVKRIQTRLVLETIVKEDNVAVSEEEFDAELNKMAEMYKMEVEKLKELMGSREQDNLKLDMAVQKAVDVVVEASKEV